MPCQLSATVHVRMLGAACAVLLLAGCGSNIADAVPGGSAPTSAPPSANDLTSVTLPGLPSAERARAALTRLTVAEPGSMDGYRRSAFSHWTEQGHRCDTREVVLRRDGKRVRRDDECRAVTGSWYSPFEGRTVTDSSDLDIDHLVPLANAWRSGADAWTDERRETFANDLENPQLLAVSAGENRTKGDQSPDAWQPPEDDFHCVYARAWTAVKSHYALTITQAERSTLRTMLNTCPT